MGKGNRIREARKQQHPANRKRNFKGWAEKGWTTPDDSRVVYMPLGDDEFSDMLPTLPKEVGEEVTELIEYFTEIEALDDAKLLGGMLLSRFMITRNDYKSLTAFAVFTNWQMWKYYGRSEPIAHTYLDFYRAASRYACENLKGAEAAFYFTTTD